MQGGGRASTIHRERRSRQARHPVLQKNNHPVQQKTDHPKWHDAMSKMLPDEEPVQTPWVNRRVDIESPQSGVAACSR